MFIDILETSETIENSSNTFPIISAFNILVKLTHKLNEHFILYCLYARSIILKQFKFDSFTGFSNKSCIELLCIYLRAFRTSRESRFISEKYSAIGLTGSIR